MAENMLIPAAFERKLRQWHDYTAHWRWLRIWWLCAVCVIVAALYGLLLPSGRTGPVDVTDIKTGNVIHATMPFLVDSPVAYDKNSQAVVGTYEYRFTYTADEIHPRKFHIVPDDCLKALTINDRPVNLSRIPPKTLCNYSEGIILDLSAYMHTGTNHIYARVDDLLGGSYGLGFYPHYPVTGSLWYWRFLFVSALVLVLLRFLCDAALRDRPPAIALGMICFACAVRVPFFFESVGNWTHVVFTGWDESTFINMGQHILEGNLPYVTLWDNKPPLLFYIFALLIKASFHSIAGIRFLGAIVIGLTGALCMALVTQLHSRAAGWYAGLGYIIYCSADTWTYSVYSDHLCAPLVVLAYLLFLSDKTPYWRRACGIGLLIGIAAMIQTNYWILAPVFALMQISWFLPYTRGSFYASLRHGLLVGLLSLVPFGIFLLVYAIHGDAELFWRSVVIAPMAHARIDLNDGIFTILATKFVMVYDNWQYRLASPIFLPYALCFFALFIWFTPSFRLHPRDKIPLLIFVVGSAFATGMRGYEFDLPVRSLGCTLFICMITGMLLAQFLTRRNLLAVALLVGCVLVALSTSYPAYNDMLARLADKAPLESDADYRMADTINLLPVAHPYIYTCETDQILYFLTHSQIPVRMAHAHMMIRSPLPAIAYDMPFTREYMLKHMFQEIKSHHPVYIVAPEDHDCLKQFGAEYMQHYRPLYQIDKVQLWQLQDR
jgi:hypothetical protein